MINSNFKLALLDGCSRLSEKHLLKFKYSAEQFYIHNFQRLLADDEIDVVASFFQSLVVEKEDLACITALTLDADHVPYSYLVDEYGELDFEKYAIRSIEGIQDCLNLEELDLNSMCRDVDLKPLIACKKLSRISIDFLTARNYRVLLELDALREIEVYNWRSFKGEDQMELTPILRTLQSRGCKMIFKPSGFGPAF